MKKNKQGESIKLELDRMKLKVDELQIQLEALRGEVLHLATLVRKIAMAVAERGEK